MRFLVAVVSAGAALTLIGASGLMNWVFMTSLGKSEFEQQILGAVSIAVSAFLALLPTLLLWAYRERRTLYIILGVPVFSPSPRSRFLPRSALPPKTAAVSAKTVRSPLHGLPASSMRSKKLGRSLKPFLLSGLSLSFRNPCAVSNKIAAGNPQNPARTRQPTPRALSARAISN